ncbi:MAG: response regulator [Caulobacterales bacterium]
METKELERPFWGGSDSTGAGENERYKLLVDSILDFAIYMLDTEGRVSSWNAGANRIKGYAPNEIVGTHFSKFYTQEDRDAGLPQKNLAIALQRGKFEGEGWRLRKNGERFWASVVIDAIHDAHGDFVGFAKITRDETDKFNARQALEKTREALFQAQKMEAVGQLTGGIAHDFNNLLMAILGSLDLASRRLPDDPRLAALIANATEGAKRGAGLTQRMLAFARRQELDIKPTNVVALVADMQDMMQRAIGSNYSIETQLEANAMPARADSNQLESALLNLVVNARDAMPDGGPIIIRVASRQAEPSSSAHLEAGDYVVLSVLDRGEGMDPGTLEKAIEPFFTTKGVGKGTGLGLSMVQGHAIQSGGAFILKSKKGFGTTAEIWLPAVGALAPEATETPLPEPTQPVRTQTILAVDDDFLVLMNTVAMLEECGHRVLSAASGAAALEIMRREDVDLVITDQAMPNMTGLQLSEAVRELRPEIPIIIATGYAELPPDKLGNIHRLGKPFMLHDLEAALAKVTT